MVNFLLDGLSADRARMRLLAHSVIQAGDRERAALARELHDSTAQDLAGLTLGLSAAARTCVDADCTARLQELRERAGSILEEVRLLSHTVHPRVLDDLGLHAALNKLARETTSVTGIEVEVQSEGDDMAVPPAAAAVLYRVAQAATHNVVRHSKASHVDVTLTVDSGVALLGIADNGVGFDVPEAERRRPGMGLFTMRERVDLAGGAFRITSAVGAGTRVLAEIPFADEPSRPRQGAAHGK